MYSEVFTVHGIKFQMILFPVFPFPQESICFSSQLLLIPSSSREMNWSWDMLNRFNRNRAIASPLHGTIPWNWALWMRKYSWFCLIKFSVALVVNAESVKTCDKIQQCWANHRSTTWNEEKRTIVWNLTRVLFVAIFAISVSMSLPSEVRWAGGAASRKFSRHFR